MILEEKEKIQEERIKAELTKALEQRKEDLRTAALYIGDLMKALIDALFRHPSHELRENVVAKMRSGVVKEIIEGELPEFAKYDIERTNVLHTAFLAQGASTFREQAVKRLMDIKKRHQAKEDKEEA